jgi:two-component system KDP operon response regulator KdpE
MMKKILVVDDSELMLEIVRHALEAAGFSALTASDLSQMEKLRDEGHPDLILVDVQMPEAYGDDVALVLRKGYNVGVPVLLFSSLDETDLAARAKRVDADGWISKRSGIEALVQRVKEFLAMNQRGLR